MKQRIEFEVAEAEVEEVYEEDKFHEVQEYFEEEEFHEVEEFVKVEACRFEEHKVDQVHRVVGFLEAEEEVEVYEKPKAPPKGIGNSADISNYYISRCN